jgi:hypothetical protein
MQKKSAIALIAVLSSTVASAGEFIVGGNLGIASGGQDAASLNDQLEENGFVAKASTSGDIRTGWQTYVSYQHQADWGLELAYVDLGAATVSFYDIEEPIDELLAGIGDIHPRSAQGAKLSLTYRFELNKKLQLQVELGGFDWSTEYTLQGEDIDGVVYSREVKQQGTNATTGAGLVHKLTNNISAHLDWDYYWIDEESINLFSLGASYRFY